MHHCYDCETWHTDIIRRPYLDESDSQEWTCPDCQSDNVEEAEVYACSNCPKQLPHELEEGLCEECYDIEFSEEDDKGEAA